MSTEIEARKASEQNFVAMNRMLNGDARAIGRHLVAQHGRAATQSP